MPLQSKKSKFEHDGKTFQVLFWSRHRQVNYWGHCGKQQTMAKHCQRRIISVTSLTCQAIKNI